MNKVLQILQSVRPDADFTTSQDFINDGLLDSFDVVTLVTELDETFATSIDGVDIVPENFKSVEAITALLKKKGIDV